MSDEAFHLTPIDIRRYDFGSALRGYDKARVDQFRDQVAAEVKAFAPDRLVLLPLYPQFSTTTTASSLADWHAAARRAALAMPVSAVCCYASLG